MPGPDIVLVAEADQFSPSEPRGAFWDYMRAPLNRLGFPGEGPMPPHPQLLGAVALGTWLAREGWSVCVHQNVFGIPRAREAFLEALSAGPAVVGISTTLLQNESGAARLAAWARERCPKALVVMGGAGANGNPAMRALADATVVGTGERTLSRLLGLLKDGGDWRDLPNLCYRNGQGEVRTERRLEVAPDELPGADWSLLEPHASLCYPIRASLGCRYDCAFCTDPERGRQRMRGVPLVVAEMRRAFERHGARLFRFADSNFTSWPEHTEEFCRALKREGLPVEWSCFARADNFASRPSLAAAMREAGCRWVFLGNESGSDEVLRRMRKGLDRGTMLEGMRLAGDAGIRLHSHFIVGFPGETPATVDETLEVATGGRLDTVFFNAFRLPERADCAVWAERERFGLKGSARDWSHATMDAGQAREETRRCVAAVVSAAGKTVPGAEGHASLVLKGSGLGDDEAMDYFRAMRDFHLAGLRKDPLAEEAALGRLKPLTERLAAFWRSRGWRPGA